MDEKGRCNRDQSVVPIVITVFKGKALCLLTEGIKKNTD